MTAVYSIIKDAAAPFAPAFWWCFVFDATCDIDEDSDNDGTAALPVEQDVINTNPTPPVWAYSLLLWVNLQTEWSVLFQTRICP